MRLNSRARFPSVGARRTVICGRRVSGFPAFFYVATQCLSATCIAFSITCHKLPKCQSIPQSPLVSKVAKTGGNKSPSLPPPQISSWLRRSQQTRATMQTFLSTRNAYPPEAPLSPASEALDSRLSLFLPLSLGPGVPGTPDTPGGEVPGPNNWGQGGPYAGVQKQGGVFMFLRGWGKVGSGRHPTFPHPRRLKRNLPSSAGGGAMLTVPTAERDTEFNISYIPPKKGRVC